MTKHFCDNCAKEIVGKQLQMNPKFPLINLDLVESEKSEYSSAIWISRDNIWCDKECFVDWFMKQTPKPPQF